MTAVLLVDTLAAEIERLWRSPQPTIVGIRQIARQLIVEATDAQAVGDFGLAKTEGSRESKAGILEASLNAARIAAWGCVHFLPLAIDAEMTVTAALLADAGRLHPQSNFLAADDVRHVSIGAALAGTVTDAPISLPQRIARHHEKSDGSGFPARLMAARLTREDKLIAAAYRCAELFEGDLTVSIRMLHEEARRGLFDVDLTANLIWSISGSMPTAMSFNCWTPSRWGLTDLGRRRLRIEAAHESPLPPHFKASRSSIHADGLQAARD